MWLKRYEDGFPGTGFSDEWITMLLQKHRVVIGDSMIKINVLDTVSLN